MNALIKRAVEFHGHLGPFLVLGLRMGLAGLRELKLIREKSKLRVNVKLPYSIPFSCTVDGLQIATKCTIGNKRLRIIDHSGIEAEFKLGGGEEVAVAVNSDFFDMLKGKLLSENVPDKEVQELAHLVSSTPEMVLFTITRR